jgi:peptidoglycan LD-endopeptidase CwlK
MPRFSENSLKHLESCHPDLQILFLQIVNDFDCSIVCGHRCKEDQDRVFKDGFSQVEYPNSKHNDYPSMAVDVIPYPTGYNDDKTSRHFVGYVLGVAAEMKRQGLIEHYVKSGIDWDGDRDLNDQKFKDLPHFELA